MSLPPPCRLCDGRKGWPMYIGRTTRYVRVRCTRCKGTGYEPPSTIDGKLLVSPPPPPKRII